MRFLVFLLALLPFISCDSTSTFETCFTRFAHKSLSPVPSTTSATTVTLQATQTSVFTPIRTIIPPPQTITSLTTSTLTTTTIIPQVTDTFSTTTTSIETNTETLTISVAITSSTVITTTLHLGTVTVSTSSGFIPAASNTPASTPASTKRRSLLPARRESPAEKNEYRPRGKHAPPVSDDQPAHGGQNVSLTLEGGKVKCHPEQYPKDVFCEETVEIFSTSTVIQTAQSTSMVTVPQTTITSVSTVFSTATSTVLVVDASTTQISSTAVQITTTVSESTTSTTTLTNTMTVTLPSATSYPNCLPNNLVSSVNGVAVGQIVTSNTMQQVTGISTAYDCCVACVNTVDCGFSAFVGSSSGSCFLVTDAPYCMPYSQLATYYTGGNGGFTVSDGNCGVGVYAGIGPPA